MGQVSMRSKFRAHVRDEALDACHALAIERGWAQVRLSEVASSVGVSRPTLYKEFGSKDGLGEALVRRETERFLVGVRETLDAHDGDVAAALTAAVQFALVTAEANPLLHAVLTATRGGDDGLLPMLTTRSSPVLDPATAALTHWFAVHAPELDQTEVREAVDVTVRLVVSHLVLPGPDPEASARLLAEVAMRYLGVAGSRNAV
jgi:AcrR family transcriptional regulator